jgi:sugar O-acyltransferase (sialic acid O-acetyltransferase NeuD family)
MIIVGAGAAGCETLQILIEKGITDVVFYDKNPKSNFIANKYPIISNSKALKNEIVTNPNFCVAIGHPRMREKMYNSLCSLNAVPKNVISNNTHLLYSIEEKSIIIQPGVCISAYGKIGKSTLIHANSVIGHQVQIGAFVNISPLCSIIGPCIIGNYSYIGAGSIVMPKVKIGNYVYISPGSIVNKDLKDFETY